MSVLMSLLATYRYFLPHNIGGHILLVICVCVCLCVCVCQCVCAFVCVPNGVLILSYLALHGYLFCFDGAYQLTFLACIDNLRLFIILFSCIDFCTFSRS